MDEEPEETAEDAGGLVAEHEGLLDRVKDWLTEDPPLRDDGPLEGEVPFVLPPPD
jgi:hypothetical protein